MFLRRTLARVGSSVTLRGSELEAILVQTKSGRSAAWLARYLGVVEVVGSNPAGPISENPVIPLGLQGFFVPMSLSLSSSKWSGMDSF